MYYIISWKAIQAFFCILASKSRREACISSATCCGISSMRSIVYHHCESDATCGWWYTPAAMVDRGTQSAPAASAPGGAEQIGPNFHWLRQFKSVSANKKSAIPDGMTDFLELLARFELATSSLPRMRSTDWAIAAFRWQLCHYIAFSKNCQELFKK